ncbi:MAG: hypothetical protein L0Y72_04220 [Gemmataceae bacterium]|nr:hypothetical protein [Gemmataceae bacterium]MCI0738225.1 hypothetical protein [Gemmataceae bacterium]
MRKLMGIGACVGFALLLAGCGEQAKKDPSAKAKGQLEQAGKALQEGLADSKAKISDAANTAAEALGVQFSKATEQAKQSLQSVKGAPELVQKVGDVIPSLQKTLAEITDKDSALKALPKLEELEGTVSKLSGQFDQLPEAAKKTVGDLIQKGTGSLQPLVDTVLAQPAVQAVRPKLEGIMKQLKGLND